VQDADQLDAIDRIVFVIKINFVDDSTIEIGYVSNLMQL
jgi:hypothetical protein